MKCPGSEKLRGTASSALSLRAYTGTCSGSANVSHSHTLLRRSMTHLNKKKGGRKKTPIEKLIMVFGLFVGRWTF